MIPADDDRVRPGEPPLAGAPRRAVDLGTPYLGSIALPPPLIDAGRTFRGQSLALGAAWICVGLAAGVMAWWLWSMDEPVRLRSVVEWFIAAAFAAVVWVGLGVMTCLRRMWAVYCGLALNYLIVVGYFLFVLVASLFTELAGARLFGAILAPLCPVLAFALSILQAHRLIRLEKQLREARLR